MQPSRFDAVLFDLGSTLLYFDADWPDVLPAAYLELLSCLQSAGLALDADDFLSRLSARVEYFYRQRETEFIEYTLTYLLDTLLSESGYDSVPPALLQQAVDALHSVTQAHWIIEPDAIPTLQTLQAQGYRLGLISNTGDDSDVQRLIDQAGLRPHFEVILTSAAEGIRKPNPRIFHKALEALGSAADRAAMVGDTLGADILGARNAGVYGIWITRRAGSPTNLAHRDTIRPDAVIDALSELPPLLSQL